MVKVGPSPFSTSLQAVVKRSASSLIDVNLEPKLGSGSSTFFHALALAKRATKKAKDFMVVRGGKESSGLEAGCREEGVRVMWE